MTCVEDLHVFAFGRGRILRLSGLWRLENTNGKQIVISNAASVAHGKRIALDARYWPPDVDDAPAPAVLERMASQRRRGVEVIIQKLQRACWCLIDVNVTCWKDTRDWCAVIGHFRIACQRSLYLR